MKKSNASRPYMPGYGLLPEKEGSGLFEWSFVEQGFTEARNYWLSTVSADGQAHAVPVWGLWHAGSFFFGTDIKSQKHENLQANPSAVAHLESGDEVVIIEGEAMIEEDGEVLKALDAKYQEKYDVVLIGGGAAVYRLVMQKAFAWLEADFPGSATRWIAKES